MAKDQRSSGHRTVNKSAETGRFVSDKAVKEFEDQWNRKPG